MWGKLLKRSFPHTPFKDFVGFFSGGLLKRSSPEPPQEFEHIFRLEKTESAFELVVRAGEKGKHLRIDGTVLPQEFRHRRDPEFSKV